MSRNPYTVRGRTRRDPEASLGALGSQTHTNPADLLVLFTLAQPCAFAPDGIVAMLVPLAAVTWILVLAAPSVIGAGWPTPGHEPGGR